MVWKESRETILCKKEGWTKYETRLWVEGNNSLAFIDSDKSFVGVGSYF